MLDPDVLIENEGPNTLAEELSRLIEKAHEIEIAVAFIDEWGVDFLVDELRKASRKKKSKVKILTRMSRDGHNSPSAFWKLLDFQNAYSEDVEVRISALENFHEKLYMICSAGETVVVMGSSNLTKRGLLEEGELNIEMKGHRSSESISSFLRNFKMHWDDSKGNELEKNVIETYENFYRGVRPVPHPSSKNRKLWRKVGSMLHRRRGTRKAQKQKVPEIWFDEVDSDATKEVCKAVENNTNWDRHNWSWYHFPSKYLYKSCSIGDIIIIKDLRERKISANLIRASTSLPIRKDRYAIAYELKGKRTYAKLDKKTEAVFRNQRSGERLMNNLFKDASRILHFKL